MKTELIRNFSTASLAAIARSDSNLSSAFGDGNQDESVQGSGGIQACCSDMVTNVCRRKTV